MGLVRQDVLTIRCVPRLRRVEAGLGTSVFVLHPHQQRRSLKRQRMSEGAYVDWYGGERRQSWGTPRSLFDSLNRTYDFTLDGASEPGNGLLPRSSTVEAPIPWRRERVFCNPPWSNIPPFVERAAEADLAVLLVPARTNCRWFHRALELGGVPTFFLGKPKFVGAKYTSPVDCLLLVFAARSPSRTERRADD